MTLIAGIFSRKKNRCVPASMCDTLLRLISRDPRDEKIVFEDKRSFFVKVDINAYGESSHTIGQDGVVTLVTGEPLLDADSDEKWHSREKDVASIHYAFS